VPRWVDVALALAGLLIAAPMFVLVALAIWITSGRPILFRQERIGRGGQPFLIHKFRTMVVDAQAAGGPLTVGTDDPRVTLVGHFLRRSKLDELPQLWNVLAGDMKFVGPRPEVPEYVLLYDESQRAVLRVHPGITDPASIEYRDESVLLASVPDPERTYREEILPRKLALNAEYLRRRNGWRDMGIIAETLMKAVLKV
jgi:lipopolysaccharide/colanic/teichoic acid biosynthesis glycosyltransferase